MLDVQLPGISGLDLQQELASGDAQIPIIFITGFGNISMSVRAMKAGAFEFLTKPFRDEDLLSAVDQAINCGRQIGQSNIQLTPNQPYPFEDELRSEISALGIVGKSPQRYVGCCSSVDTVAPNDSTVLILGETGGPEKSFIVSAIHEFRRLSPSVDPTSFGPRDVDQAEPEYLTEVEMRRRERQNLFAVLQKAGWRIKGVDGAAELLGVSPTTLFSRIERWV